MKKLIFTSLHLYIFASFCAFAQVQVSANFGTWAEYPLVKKIGVYQTPLTCAAWLTRDLPKMSEIEARAFRYEFAWGKDLYATKAISGSLSSVQYNYTDMDLLFNKASKNTTAFVFAQGYTPGFLQSQSGGNGWQSPPSDYDVWQEINRHMAVHWKVKKFSNRYYEVWNEPDLPNGFFSGTLDDYLQIYKYAALGVMKGDSDGKVGGPAIAYMTAWHQSLVDFAKQNDLPVDFLSGHAYGENFNWQLDAMRQALNSYGNNSSEMLLTEYSPYVQADYAANGKVERAEAAMTFFNALSTMLEYTDLTYVTWAQYIDPEEGTTGHAYTNWDKLGIVDGNKGKRKAIFNAFKLYGMMPADRCNISTGTLSGMASKDDSHVAMVLWNTSADEKKIRVRLSNIPFSSGTLEAYRIDTEHNSWYELGDDALTPLYTKEVSTTDTYVISDTIGAQGVYFVRISAPEAQECFPQNNFARLISTKQWYQSRLATSPYAQFDSKTWTAYLSTNKFPNGLATMCVTAENVPTSFVVRCKTNTLNDTGKNSTLHLRMDFQNKEGEYVKSVLYHGGLWHSNRTTAIQWGTKREPDTVVQVADISEFVVNTQDYLPADFSGRVLFTFCLEATGAGSKADMQLVKLEDTGVEVVSQQVTGSREQVVGSIYDLTGRRVSGISGLSGTHGIYIANNKKYLIQ